MTIHPPKYKKCLKCGGEIEYIYTKGNKEYYMGSCGKSYNKVPYELVTDEVRIAELYGE